jgi:hypothetical protein
LEGDHRRPGASAKAQTSRVAIRHPASSARVERLNKVARRSGQRVSVHRTAPDASPCSSSSRTFRPLGGMQPPGPTVRLESSGRFDAHSESGCSPAALSGSRGSRNIRPQRSWNDDAERFPSIHGARATSMLKPITTALSHSAAEACRHPTAPVTNHGTNAPNRNALDCAVVALRAQIAHSVARTRHRAARFEDPNAPTLVRPHKLPRSQHGNGNGPARRREGDRCCRAAPRRGPRTTRIPGPGITGWSNQPPMEPLLPEARPSLRRCRGLTAFQEESTRNTPTKVSIVKTHNRETETPINHG